MDSVACDYSRRSQRSPNLSPIFDANEDLVRNGICGGKQKIRRLMLAGSAYCEIVNIESPHVFWIRLKNHITDCEQLKPPKTLEKSSEDDLMFNYFFAPKKSQDGSIRYVRGRVVKVVQRADGPFVLVHYIDFGTRDWMHANALAKLPEKFYFYPWQAFGCSLFKIEPNKTTGGRELDGKGRPKWNQSEVDSFRAVVSEYTDFRIQLVQAGKVSNDARKMIVVELLGRPIRDDQESETEPEKIAPAFYRANAETVSLNREIFDADDHCPNEAPIPRFEFAVPEHLEEWQMEIAPDLLRSGEDEFEEETPLFTGRPRGVAAGPQIPLVKVNDLIKDGFIKPGSDSLLIHVEGARSVSPYEFYGRPIKAERIYETDDGSQLVHADDIVKANDNLLDFVDQLQRYYGEKDNQRSVDIPQIRSDLDQGYRVYAVGERTDEMARYTGTWQRVELLAVRNVGDESRERGRCRTPFGTLVRIRFIDSGGTDIQDMSSLLRIHPTHTVQPPFCIQFCLYGITPQTGGFFDGESPDTSQWNDAAKIHFLELLREDVPMQVTVIGRLNRHGDGKPQPYMMKAFERPNVIFVQHVKVQAPDQLRSGTIEEQMIGCNMARGITEKVDVYTTPFPVVRSDGCDDYD